MFRWLHTENPVTITCFLIVFFLVALSWRKLCTELHVLGNSVQNCPVSRGPVCETGEVPDTLPCIFGTITTRS